MAFVELVNKYNKIIQPPTTIIRNEVDKEINDGEIYNGLLDTLEAENILIAMLKRFMIIRRNIKLKAPKIKTYTFVRDFLFFINLTK
jgi:hypothetical protein